MALKEPAASVFGEKTAEKVESAEFSLMIAEFKYQSEGMYTESGNFARAFNALRRKE